MLNYLLVSVSIFSEEKKRGGGVFVGNGIGLNFQDNSTYGIWATEEIEKARGFERERERERERND